jgi:hypothetical protein
MDSGPVQGLVGIDVSHSGEKMLVQEEGFDLPTPGPHPGHEFRRGDFQGLGAQSGEGNPPTLFFSFPEDPPKPAGVDEPQLLSMVQEGKDQVSVFFTGNTPGQDAQSPAHPQVNEHGAPPAQAEDDIFSPPLYSQDFLFSQKVGQRSPAAPHAFLLADLHPGELPADDAGPQAAHDRFHFRQLRHASSFPSIPSFHPGPIFSPFNQESRYEKAVRKRFAKWERSGRGLG